MEWISVKDRLPDESGNYFAGCKSGWIASLPYSAKHKAWNVQDFFPPTLAEAKKIDVDWWMPIPRLPEEDEA